MRNSRSERRAIRRCAAATMLMALTVLAAGCGPSTGVGRVDGHTSVVITYPPGATSVTAIGELIEVGSCIGVQIDEEPVLAVFPPGTRIFEDKSIVLPEGSRLALGNEVQLKGRYVDIVDLSGYEQIPAECVSSEAFLVGHRNDS